MVPGKGKAKGLFSSHHVGALGAEAMMPKAIKYPRIGEKREKLASGCK